MLDIINLDKTFVLDGQESSKKHAIDHLSSASKKVISSPSSARTDRANRLYSILSLVL